MFNKEMETIVEAALKEDVGFGDLTTEICIAPDTLAEAEFIAKEPGILCGSALVRAVFRQVEPSLKVFFNHNDGYALEAGDVIATVRGRARGILTGERTALNFLQHLSGIATKTRSCVDQVKGMGTKIVDTRKTTPGLRVLEKQAVSIGGGGNHRFGLDDGILIKDNHIAGAGGVAAAVALAKAHAPHTLKVEVEVADLVQLKEALEAGADIIMLDNMDLETMAEAVRIVGGRAVTEASGNMGDRDLREVAGTGVDLISIGALTNAVRGMDISLKFKDRNLQ